MYTICQQLHSIIECRYWRALRVSKAIIWQREAATHLLRVAPSRRLVNTRTTRCNKGDARQTKYFIKYVNSRTCRVGRAPSWTTITALTESSTVTRVSWQRRKLSFVPQSSRLQYITLCRRRRLEWTRKKAGHYRLARLPASWHGSHNDHSTIASCHIWVMSSDF